jgi:uncharacterized protein YbcC (UPF0753/DUF2309 family)
MTGMASPDATSHAIDETGCPDGRHSIGDLVEHLAHLLPSQGPLEAFVHHNTLHAFEDRSFHDGIVEGGRVLGCRSYMPEAWYHDAVATGRIRTRDLEASLARTVADDRSLGRFGTVLAIRRAMLQAPIPIGSDAEIRWWLRDARAVDAASAAVIEDLWSACRDAVAETPGPEASSRRRARQRQACIDAAGVDPDDLVHEFLIPFLAAFLDQGMARRPLPERDRGFLAAFSSLHRGLRPSSLVFDALPRHLARIERVPMSPDAIIEEVLDAFRVAPGDREAFLRDALLALSGWAGMLHQAEGAGDLFDWTAPAGTLREFLAVRLLLDRIAAEHLLRDHGGERAIGRVAVVPGDRVSTDRRAFTLLQVARRLDVDGDAVRSAESETRIAFVREVEAFDEMARCRVLHEAYEDHYHGEILNALAIHAPTRTRDDHADGDAGRRPAFQVVCCIDEREESFRRHLEELAPEAETLGFAGFFGVAMKYRGAGEAHYRKLCPVPVTPRHEVVEEPLFAFEDASRLQAAVVGRAGAAALRMHHGSRSLLGGVMTGLLGLVATVPLVARVLLPRTSAQLSGFVGRAFQPPVTTLHLEREDDVPGPSGLLVGFDVEEMTAIVEQVLTLMGLRTGFARLVLMAGHGSSSMNNPHEAAHDCGACSGGRGGPNARAFAAMANDPRVRVALADRGLDIPDDTIFVGAYHNTCNEDVVYHDLDRIPRSHRAEFVRMRGLVDLARRRNAHERCRRFDHAPRNGDDRAALWHVEARAEDLSQVRPEYGHATNAVCLVGRRSWSRDLFLDRRAFLASYDPAVDDDDRSVLAGLLGAVIPVCAGISLEYFFSFVDPAGYGCGTKLPHNICGLLGVMEGTRSDLRTGLPWQMVEIHEPMRLLAVVECDPDRLDRLVHSNPTIERLVGGEWLRLAALDPTTGCSHLWRDGGFHPVELDADPRLPRAADSCSWYEGRSDHLAPAVIETVRSSALEGACS